MIEWSSLEYRSGDTVSRFVRLRPPFDVRVVKPGRGVFYFVVGGSFWLDCDVFRDGPRHLSEGTGVGISAPHVVRHKPGDAPGRELTEADLTPFLAPPEAGLVHLFMSDAPARVALHSERGKAALVMPPGSQTADNLGHIVALARNELSAPTVDTGVAMRRLGEMIMIQMLRFSRGQVQAPDEALRRRAGHDDRLMRAVMAFLEAPARSWTVQDLADVAGMSRAAFSAHFHAMMGEPPLLCLTRLRLQEAAVNLELGSKSLVEIAASVGYDSENGFIRAFRREFGLSPRAWRNEMRSQL